MFKEPIDPNELANIPQWIQPVMVDGFSERYTINLRDGTIYDLDECMRFIPELIDDQLMVTLIDETGDSYDFLIGDLLIRSIYGYTNSSFRPALLEYPCNTANLVPRIHHLNEIDERRIEINGITYYRWLNTEYYASAYGVIFSVPYGSFLRRNFNEKSYCIIATRENGIKKHYRLHRIVWESIHNRQIPADKEIDHINDKRWDNRASNLQLLTHLENLQKINPEKFKTYSEDLVISIAKDLQNKIPTKIIAEKYGVDRNRVRDIKFRNAYSDILSKNGIILPKLESDNASPFKTEEVINDIIQMYKNNTSAVEIANKYNVTKSYIHRIIRNNADIKSA